MPAPACLLRWQRHTVRNHKVLLRAKCSVAASGVTRGTVRVRVSRHRVVVIRYAGVRTSLPAGAWRTVRVTLPNSAMRFLRRHKAETLTATLTTHNLGGTGVARLRTARVYP